MVWAERHADLGLRWRCCGLIAVARPNLPKPSEHAVLSRWPIDPERSTPGASPAFFAGDSRCVQCIIPTSLAALPTYTGESPLSRHRHGMERRCNSCCSRKVPIKDLWHALCTNKYRHLCRFGIENEKANALDNAQPWQIACRFGLWLEKGQATVPLQARLPDNHNACRALLPEELRRCDHQGKIGKRRSAGSNGKRRYGKLPMQGHRRAQPAAGLAQEAGGELPRRDRQILHHRSFRPSLASRNSGQPSGGGAAAMSLLRGILREEVACGVWHCRW